MILTKLCGEVPEYSARLASVIGLTESRTLNLRMACMIHDIGKIGIAERILHKPGRLDVEEQSVIAIAFQPGDDPSHRGLRIHTDQSPDVLAPRTGAEMGCVHCTSDGDEPVFGAEPGREQSFALPQRDRDEPVSPTELEPAGFAEAPFGPQGPDEPGARPTRTG